jgi:hypothetical protein
MYCSCCVTIICEYVEHRYAKLFVRVSRSFLQTRHLEDAHTDRYSKMPQNVGILPHQHTESEPRRPVALPEDGGSKVFRKRWYPTTLLYGVKEPRRRRYLLKMDVARSSETLVYYITMTSEPRRPMVPPEDGGSTVLRNIVILHHYTASDSCRPRLKKVGF